MMGCQMVYFQTKIPNLGKFRRVLQWKMLVFLWAFGKFYGHLVYFMAMGIFDDFLVYFFTFWYVVERKFWQP
jgi:hypothetical protein